MPDTNKKESSPGRQSLRWFLAIVITILVVFFCWTHRILLLVKPLTKMGVASAQYRLALEIKEQSRSAVGSDADYHDWLVRAAEQGHVEAMMRLIWDPRSREEKLHWMTVAAESGMEEAQYQLYLMLLDSGPGVEASRKGLAWLEKAANSGHMQAQYDLGRYYVSGHAMLGIEKDPAKARQWWERAAEGGMAEAQYQLYLMVLNSDPGIEAAGKGREWLEKAANNGHMAAQYDLGSCYFNGHAMLGIEKDHDRACQWWDKAADNGHGRAMEELCWRYEKGADGFPYNPQRAIALLNWIAEAYQYGINGLPQNQQMAGYRREHAEQIATLEAQLAQGDPQAQLKVGLELVRIKGATPETIATGVALLEKAAGHGDPQPLHELGRLFLFGRPGLEIDLPRGRNYWAKALEKNHVRTMEYVVPALQNGRFGYPVDLLKSKALVERLVDAYRDGLYGVDPDPKEERYWRQELKHFDRLFELAGGDYQSPDELQPKAEAGDPQAQYQLGRQLMISGAKEHRQQGLRWIERAADGGYAEAQYRLVTYFESQAGIMHNDPARGVAILRAAAEQNHLRAMGALALGYYKGRYGMNRDYRKAKYWYERLLKAYASGSYLGQIDESFILFQRQQLKYTTKALEIEIEKARQYKEASPLERQIIEIKEHYRIEFEKEVNDLDRSDGSPAGKERIRAEINRLRDKYNRLKEKEISRIKSQKEVPVPNI